MKNRHMLRVCEIFFHTHRASPCICHIELDRGKVHKNYLIIIGTIITKFYELPLSQVQWKTETCRETMEYFFSRKTQHSSSPYICHIALDRGKVHKKFTLHILSKGWGIIIYLTHWDNTISHYYYITGSIHILYGLWMCTTWWLQNQMLKWKIRNPYKILDTS